MVLTHKQKLTFFEDGYVQLSGAVPRLMVEAARHAINHSIGNVGMHEEDLEILRARSYCRELQNEAVMTDLFNRTPVFQLLESLLGVGNVQLCRSAQIALRFPGPPFADPGEPRGHLDGLGPGTNGMEKGTYARGFTGLAVIYLSRVAEPYSGNFTVWPGSHRFFEEYFTRHGHGLLKDGMPQVELPRGPVQITGEPGDVVLTHHQLVHSAAPNASPGIRYAAIFRVRHAEYEQVGLEAFTDIWREWPGIREAVAAS